MRPFDLEIRLKALQLGDIRYFKQIPSTNDMAARWIIEGCPDLSLVIADEQTAGRGRGGRKWYTPAGSALAFSLILRSEERIKTQNITRLNGLGALAVCQSVSSKFQLTAKIKWPNDILVDGKKLGGVLVETQWIGNKLLGVVLGVGINVATTSVPPVNWDPLNLHPFPATCLESALGRPVERWELLYSVLEALLEWDVRFSEPEFLQAWQNNLAYKDEWVQVLSPGKDETLKIGRIVGLEKDGALQVELKSGGLSSLRTGEIHPSDPPLDGFRLRPVDSL